MIKKLPAMQKTWVWSLGQEDPLEKGMAAHSSTLAWRIPWTEEPGGLQSMGSQRIEHGWATHFHFSLDPFLTCSHPSPFLLSAVSLSSDFNLWPLAFHGCIWIWSSQTLASSCGLQVFRISVSQVLTLSLLGIFASILIQWNADPTRLYQHLGWSSFRQPLEE